MLLDIIILVVVVLFTLTACACVAGARTAPTAPTTTTTTAAPKVKDQRPLWAQAPMADYIPRCSAWENEQASFEARLKREAQAGKDRPLPKFVPSPEPPPQRKFHRPLKAKSRNWA